MKDNTSIVRILLTRIFGAAYLKLEGKAHVIEEQFMQRLNLAVSQDSLKQSEAELAALTERLATEATDEVKQLVDNKSEEVEALKASVQRAELMIQNLVYKRELLNRI